MYTHGIRINAKLVKEELNGRSIRVFKLQCRPKYSIINAFITLVYFSGPFLKELVSQSLLNLFFEIFRAASNCLVSPDTRETTTFKYMLNCFYPL